MNFFKNKISHIFKDTLVLDTVVVFVGTSLGGVFNLFYHLISVRLLSPEDYGTFNTIISLMMFSSMAISPLSTAFTRFFTEYITKKDFVVLTNVFSKLFKNLLITAFCALTFFLIASFPLARFLNTERVYIIICGVVISVTLCSLPFPSLFQSFQKFKIYSFIGIISALGKLILGGLMMFFGWGIIGGLSGSLISPILIILMALLFIPGIYKKQIGHLPNQPGVTVNLVPIYKYFFPVSVAMLSFSLLTNIDVVLVKHFFSPLDVGYYSIAQMVGKIVLFLPTALATVIFPKSTEAFVNNCQSNKLLYKSLILAGILCGFITVLSFLHPDFILRIITAKLNPVSRALVGLFSLTMSFYALTWITINFSLATHNLRFVLPLLSLAILETIFIYNYHPTLLAVLSILWVFSIISFLVTFIISRAKKRYA